MKKYKLDDRRCDECGSGEIVPVEDPSGLFTKKDIDQGNFEELLLQQEAEMDKRMFKKRVALAPWMAAMRVSYRCLECGYEYKNEPVDMSKPIMLPFHCKLPMHIYKVSTYTAKIVDGMDYDVSDLHVRYYAVDKSGEMDIPHPDESDLAGD